MIIRILVMGIWLLLAATAANAQSEATLEEIIVTAEAREENLQSASVAVTAFSAQDIIDAGIETTADFIALTPNVTFDDSFSIGNSFVSVRGVTQINNADSPVAIIVDGVPQNNQKQLKMDLYDLERIEVLRGPQGALYGRNAIGGAINIITRQPTNEIEGHIQAGAGSGGLIDLSGAVGGPIREDKLLFRVAGSYRESDGLIDNTFLSEKVDFFESTDFRGKLTWFATEDVTLDIRVATSNIDGGAIYDTAFWDNSGPTNTNTNRLPLGDILGVSERDTSDASLKIDWQTPAVLITSITGVTSLDENYFGDLDFCNPVDCPGGFFGFGQVSNSQDLDVSLFSQELRFTSPDDQSFRWIAGASLIETERDLDTLVNLVDADNLPLVMSFEQNDNTAWSFFGQVEYDLSARWEISGSLRYDRDRRKQTDATSGASRERTFSSVQPRLTLTWNASDDMMLYGTYATGFRSGGFNGIGGRDFEEENVSNFELGYKSTFLNNRLRINAAAFHSTSDDFQFFFVDLNAGGAQVIDNLDEVTLRGIEVEVDALLSENWIVYGALGLLDSEIDVLDPNLLVPAAVGNKTPKTTDSTLTLGTQIGFDLGQLEASFRVDYERRGDKYWHTDNVDVMKSVNILNARISIQAQRWMVTLWGRNIGNEFYYEDFNAVPFTGLPWNIAFPTKPDHYGIDVRYDF